MRITCTLSLLGLLAACSSPQSEPAPTPTPVARPAQTPPPAPAPIPAPVGNWTEWPLAQGDWVYRNDDRGSLALFGDPGQDAQFMIRCDQADRRIYISHNTAPDIKFPKNGGQMTIKASSGLKTFPARTTGDGSPYAAIAIAPDEYMLDRIAFSRGRFAIETTGLRSLAIPIWPEFTRVVEDCRN